MKDTTPQPTLRELFLAEQAIKNTRTVLATDEWPAYAAAHAGPLRPTVVLEARPTCDAENARLAELMGLMNDTAGLADLRDVALVARHLFPATRYQVGTGSSHVWIAAKAHGADDRPQLLARIVPADQVNHRRELATEEAGTAGQARRQAEPDQDATYHAALDEYHAGRSHVRPARLNDEDRARINEFLTECHVLPAHVLDAHDLEWLRDVATQGGVPRILEKLLTHYNELRHQAATPAPPMFT